MPDMLTHGKLFTVEVDGHGSMIARSMSGVEIARAVVEGNDTAGHIVAGENLMYEAFENLRAQGYPHAHDDEDFSRQSTEDMEVEV